MKLSSASTGIFMIAYILQNMSLINLAVVNNAERHKLMNTGDENILFPLMLNITVMYVTSAL